MIPIVILALFLAFNNKYILAFDVSCRNVLWWCAMGSSSFFQVLLVLIISVLTWAALLIISRKWSNILEHPWQGPSWNPCFQYRILFLYVNIWIVDVPMWMVSLHFGQPCAAWVLFQNLLVDLRGQGALFGREQKPFSWTCDLFPRNLMQSELMPFS